MRTLTIELDVRDRPALVIGARGEAVSKIERLLHAGARVTVIASNSVDPSVEEAAREGRIELLRRAPDDRDVEGRAVVFIEPGEPSDSNLSRRLFERARALGTLLCTLDRPEVSTFINPAVVHVSGLSMSVSTGGRSPALARRIREDLEAIFRDERFARFLDALGALRSALPRGERGARIKEAVEGFKIEARLRFPGWFERGEGP
ncbi:MAG: bifunctional precorrin-2 dehydrogenase/sirohydrochlorin ferrochelatase [Polyangiaceae bacterium]|nr:bifunctional precorrin-2 dehydrogenase/sirohydrochlorin ferrochelatase [Polyangiaceae bacterium]NUQ76348.1 bifunctional precorrin-2 dehydrogenase/sirohydrochlorin ferrochelatase [Polyangiaceae bacterium]